MIKSKIYKELNEKEIRDVCIDLYGFDTIIDNFKLLKGGMFNTTYLINTTKAIKPIVVRVAPINKHLLFNFEKDMMSAEPMLHDMLHVNDIPTAKIIKHVIKGKVITREYIVSEYIDSIVMNDPLLENVDLSYVYKEIGRITNRIHTIQNEKFGWKRKSGCGEFDTWYEFIIAFVNETAERAKQNELFSRQVISDFRMVFQKNFDLLNEIEIPYMAHTDLWQGNILLKKNGGKYKVAAVIDLDRTIFGDKYWDLSSPWITNKSFYIGYNRGVKLSESQEERCKLYRLLSQFFETYVWLIEYDDKVRFASEKNKSINLLNMMR